MNDEIKEIINKLAKKSSIYKTQINRGTSFNDDEYEASLLLDCITNLQKQLEEYQKALDETMSEKIDLQQENERLKENNQAYQEELCKTWDKRDNLYRKIYMAIEYIQEDIIGNYFKRYDDEIYKMCADLLNILKGDDENGKRK